MQLSIKLSAKGWAISCVISSPSPRQDGMQDAGVHATIALSFAHPCLGVMTEDASSSLFDSS